MDVLNRLFRRYWFGELLLGGIFGSILLVAFLLDPAPHVVTLFGWEVPSMCGFRNLTGVGCPGCGLTRSFAFMAHGDLVQAFSMNKFGPLLFLAFATQPPYRLYTMVADLLGWRQGSKEGV